MKPILFFLLPILFLTTCKKNGSNNPETPKYFLHFKANGQAFAYDGDANGSHLGPVWSERLRIGPTIQLVIHASGNPLNSVLVLLNVDSVKSGQTYNLDDISDGAFLATFNGKDFRTHAATSVNPQYEVTMNIKTHSGGLIEGTFYGKVAAPIISGGFDVITIVDGSFNSKVIYR